MAQSSLKRVLTAKINLQESYASLILGAIIVVILGLLVANFLNRKNQGSIDLGDQTQFATEQAAEPQAGSEYTVRKNDSLSKISEQVYGSQEFWPQIARVNNIVTPNRILAGNRIQLPAKESVQPVKDQVVADTLQTSYQVAQGETFFTIAEKVYGDGSMWPTLHRANGSMRLPNGNPLVYANSTITVPR